MKKSKELEVKMDLPLILYLSFNIQINSSHVFLPIKFTIKVESMY